jgi:mannosyl-3-phosphoglycerate phosphatase
MQPISILIFSDLDGTLLDHDDYGFDPARPALAAIRELGIPLILNTSKTLAEVAAINQVLDNHHPTIVENGSALCFPLDHEYPFELVAHETLDAHRVIRLSPPYAEIRHFIQQQRGEHGWRLRGFGDMRTQDVMELAGLDEASAHKAMQRMGSEPFLWLDDQTALARFRQIAQDQGLTITRGGRFWHLMGQTSKAEGTKALRTLYAVNSTERITSVALGDSENDKAMLQNADIAVVIKRPDGSHLECHGIRQTLLTEQPGPAGWNEAILQILSQQSRDTPEG